MARPIVLGNGEMHVGINTYGMVHDFYYPYVGLENHSAGSDTRHRLGVWVDGKISWLDEGGWQISCQMADAALVGHVTARNDALGVLLETNDFIDTELSVFMRNFTVVNLRTDEREFRIFLHQAFAIGDSRSNTDTAQYLPDSDAVLHYRGRRAFVISGIHADGSPFDQSTVGLFGIEGREGTYRDADDGELSGAVVEHGRVDSTLRFKLNIKGHDSSSFNYWIAAGTSTREALFIHKQVQDQGINTRLDRTVQWWHEWLEPVLSFSKTMSPDRARRFSLSAMILKSHIDKRGAIIASTDTTMLNYSRDAYGYCWPRDGAYVLWPLMRLGYESEPHRFFEFCRRALHPAGYLMHKYQADGALGSSWHPYVHNDEIAPPIQEDETALVLFMFSQYYHMHPDKKMLHEFYDNFIKRMADFMAGYIDDQTGLPKASYDLWEEVYQTSTYTTAVVHAGLLAAAELAEIMEDAESAVSWRSAANDIQVAAEKHLYNRDRGAFYKGVLSNSDGIQYDQTIDLSSFFGAFMFGLFPIDSEEIRQTFATIQTVFDIDSVQCGAPRYEHDNYRLVSEGILGNWWFITSLWLAQFSNETGDSSRAHAIIEWIEEVAGDTRIMAEQINPFDKSQLSVSPLVWSHAEYMATLIDIYGSSTDAE